VVVGLTEKEEPDPSKVPTLLYQLKLKPAVAEVMESVLLTPGQIGEPEAAIVGVAGIGSMITFLVRVPITPQHSDVTISCMVTVWAVVFELVKVMVVELAAGVPAVAVTPTGRAGLKDHA
jgi:hypothetical protein